MSWVWARLGPGEEALEAGPSAEQTWLSSLLCRSGSWSKGASSGRTASDVGKADPELRVQMVLPATSTALVGLGEKSQVPGQLWALSNPGVPLPPEVPL